MTSVLMVLCARVMPVSLVHGRDPYGKIRDYFRTKFDREPAREELPASQFERPTTWGYITVRECEALSGCDDSVVQASLEALEMAGILAWYVAPHQRPSRVVRFYQLDASQLYPWVTDSSGKNAYGEAYRSVPAGMIFGGWLSLLPTAAARHLLLVLIALDPIGTETAYQDRMNVEGSSADRAIQERRLKKTVSTRRLMRALGFSRGSLPTALEILRALDRERPIVEVNQVAGARRGRYTIRVECSRFAEPVVPDLERLNDPEAVRQLRQEIWGDTQWARGRKRPRLVGSALPVASCGSE